MNPWALLGIVLAVGTLTGGAYWQGRKDGANAEIATQAREDRATAVASDAAASAIAAAIPKITVRHQTVRQEVEREIQVQEVYRDPGCRTGADSLRLYNSTIPGAPASAASDAGPVPAAHAGH